MLRLSKRLLLSILAIALVLTISGGAIAAPSLVSPEATVASKITYQGKLADASGNALTGTYNMAFSLYTVSFGGVAVWTSGTAAPVSVERGLFTVVLSVDASKFNGQALWLSTTVNGELLTPRQEITPAPYALSLRPGARIEAGAANALTATGSGPTVPVISGQHTGDGPAIYGSTSGAYPAVEGMHDGSGPAVGGYNTSSGSGVAGNSTNGYGGYFTSSNFRGLYAKGATGLYAAVVESPSGSSGPGLYVDGALYVSGSKTGYVVDLAQNVGDSPLETGDVVVIVGFGEPVVGQIPLVKVRKATQDDSTAVAGVVDQAVDLIAQTSESGAALPTVKSVTASIADGSAVSPQGYVNIVTLGSFRAIKVDASYGAIAPGDLLVSSGNAGLAKKTTNPGVGTVIGKALGELHTGTGTIPVLVTLH